MQTTENKIEFLKTVHPFDKLPGTVLSDVAELMIERQFDEETIVYTQDKSEITSVDILVEGQYDASFYDSNNILRLQEHYIQHSIYGGSSVLLNKKYSIRTVTAQKGTSVLSFDKEEFKALCYSYKDFFQFFTTQFGQKMLNDEYAHFIKRNNTLEGNFIDADNIFTRKISSITPRPLITCGPETPAFVVADLMVKKEVNCIYIEEDNKLVGIITKDILVKKVIAHQAKNNVPVIKIAKKKILSIPSNALLYEALLAMFQSKLEYIIVRDGETNLGYLSRYRLMTEHAQSPLVFIQSVKLSNTVLELKEKWDRVPELISRLLDRGVNAEIVNRIVTTIADEILLKVIEGVKDEMPPAPAKYAFMVMGSEGRQEQTLVTDQDNAIIYEDKANEQRELVRDYFLDFADRISTRLNDIGFSFCDGGFMAKNPKWTHSLSHWKGNYDEWINLAAPDTVIKFATFFDCRFIYGEKKLFNELKQHMIDCISKSSSSKFLFNVASNALHYEPPLTFFNSIRTFSQDEKKVFNIKKSMTPIVDLMRMLALKNMIIETNTGQRMQKLYSGEFLSENQFNELQHVYYYLMGVRLKNQSRSILVDFEQPSNLIEPKKLTQVEQATLREIFKFIKDFQSMIRLEFKL
jgi:CBS domain-containing protein